MNNIHVSLDAHQFITGIIIDRVIIGFELLSPYIEIPMNDIADFHGQFTLGD